MAKLTIHLLNFHGIFSHIEIVLENKSTEPHLYYGINRWDSPSKEWSEVGPRRYIGLASSVYSFDIEADPIEIQRKWTRYYRRTQDEASVLGNNCAVAAQWFLKEFARIPEPSGSNISLNHLALGVIWPSIIPCPVTLPGRIMSNAKFYIENKVDPGKATQYTDSYLYRSMLLSASMLIGSSFGLYLAISVLNGGIAAFVMAGSVAVGLASTQGIFSARNTLSAKAMIGSTHQQAEVTEDHVVIEIGALS